MLGRWAPISGKGRKETPDTCFRYALDKLGPGASSGVLQQQDALQIVGAGRVLAWNEIPTGAVQLWLSIESIHTLLFQVSEICQSVLGSSQH